ncbi:hypothetical protein HNY73_005363 [Argiope bruennichi]|uniref:Uncharacterized protein n=1 Tax=Argiope bruennichi TaxID=94029 RepID=A0A8T0FLQ0_ARGBR|nr:hypothetical protein HNY73_005363 [Argiope bruennichi]
MTPRRRRQNRRTTRFSRRRAPNQSSISSNSNSSSFETGSQSRAQRGIENPTYNPSFQVPTSSYQQPSAPGFSWSEPNMADPTPILDMPPSYETAVNIEQFPKLRLENHDWKPPRRHLLWRSSSSSMTGPELAVYIIAVVIITFISICCKYCIREGCEPTDNYRDAVVHPPPRNPTVPIAPSSGRRLLNPPRSSGSIILPPEDGVFAVDLTGIENPNYNPSIHLAVPSYHPSTAPQFSMNEPNNENPTPILDLPPSYESSLGEGDGYLQLSTSRRQLDGTTYDFQRHVDYQTDGQYYKTVFFVLLGIGLAIFIGLIIVCYRVAKVFEGLSTSSVSGTTVHPPNFRANYNLRTPDEIGIAVSYVNSAYSSGPVGRSEVDRPPDYSTVTTNDAINRNAAFPQVVTTHIETPPPKYEEGPVFR